MNKLTAEEQRTACLKLRGRLEEIGEITTLTTSNTGGNDRIYLGLLPDKSDTLAEIIPTMSGYEIHFRDGFTTPSKPAHEICLIVSIIRHFYSN
jgi:hypothetical protein